MKETVITIKIFFHGIKQLFSIYFACIEYIFFDGRKGISGCGKAGPVKTIVVVNTAEGDVPSVFQTAIHHQGKERSRENVKVFGVFTHLIHPFLNLFCHGLKEGGIVGGVGQMSGNGFAHNIREAQRIDIGNFHSSSRYDEFPAGRHGIIACILRAVAQFFKSRDNHVIVGILREAKPLFGQLGSQFID